MDKIKVIIVDDHELFREGLRGIIDNEEDMSCVASVGAGEEAIKTAEELNADVILVDIEMPGMNGLEAAGEIKASRPSTAIIILSAYQQQNYVSSAMRARVNGYLTKGMHPNDLLQAIRLVHNGGAVFSPEASQGIFGALGDGKKTKEITQLHDRELDILRLIAGGFTNKEISQRLHLSNHTVRSHVESIFSKLGVASRTEAAMVATKKGLISASGLLFRKDLK